MKQADLHPYNGSGIYWGFSATAVLALITGSKGKNMRAMIIAALLAASPAIAADLPVKAPMPSVFLYPYNGSGFYWGVNFTSDGAIDNSGHGSFASSGGAYGGTLGYQVGNGTYWAALELMGDWSNAKGGDAFSSSVTTWSFEQRVKVGSNLLGVLSTLPAAPWAQAPLPALPQTQGAAALMHPYVFGGAYEHKTDAQLLGMSGSAWKIAPTVGVGVLTQVLSGSVVDVWGEYVAPTTAVPTAFGPVSQGQQYRVGVSLLF